MVAAPTLSHLTARQCRRARRTLQRAEAKRLRKITAATPYSFIDEQLTPFGGAFALEKLLDALAVEQAFEEHFIAPARTPELGHWRMVKGILALHFMGLSRLYHFTHVNEDPMLKGVLALAKLPAVSTFWRCLNSYGLNQDRSFLKINAVVRERAWRSLHYDARFSHIHVDIDTTVKTVYGNKEGARKGHNRKHRGKRGLRPVLAFIAETKEYVAGKLRRGATISGNEIKKFIRELRTLLPSSVHKVTVRADSEFYCWEAVSTCRAEGLDFIFSVKKSRPEFDEKAWYSAGQSDVQYNAVLYQPKGWKTLCRFVAMRIRKDPNAPENQQLECFDDDLYKYRIFVTSREADPHRVIAEYDDRAAAEQLIGEAQRECLTAIPSKQFARNRAYFQLAMLSYNLWRHVKAFANKPEESAWSRQTNNVSRLQLLYLAAKVTSHSERVEIKYSEHLAVKPTWEYLLTHLDEVRAHREVWQEASRPLYHNTLLRPRQQDRIVHKILCTADG